MHAFHPLSADCGQLQRSEIGSKWFFGGRNGSMNMFIRGGRAVDRGSKVRPKRKPVRLPDYH